MLHVGDTVPSFELPDADMDIFSPSFLLGKSHAVFFFYPRDGSPLCTLEAADFSDHESDFNRHHCAILGISRDDCMRHADFRDKHGLSVRLLSDEEGEVCNRFGVIHDKEVDGIRKRCVIRSTFIVDMYGIIRHALYDVQPRGHVAAVFQLVKELDRTCRSPKTPLSRSLTA